MAHAVESMFSVREKPWHYEMTKDVTKIIQEAPTSLEALTAAGLNWEVEPKRISILGEDSPIPNAIANVRSSDGAVLGLVTDYYKIVQNVDAFAFTDTLIGGDVRYETAGSLNGGKRVWLLAKLPDTKIAGDDVEPFICFTNNHDGTGAVRCMMTPVRVVCNNTLNMALSTAKRSWSAKHTGDINKKIAEARESLGLAEKYMSELGQYAEHMANVRVDEDTLKTILDSMFAVKETDTDLKKKHAQNYKDNFMLCYAAPDIAKFSGTAWGALNAMADMVAHCKPNRETQSYQENNWGRIMGGHPLVDQMARMIG